MFATPYSEIELSVRQGYGRVSIGHSELNGSQRWDTAVEYGKKAAERAAAML